MRRPPLTRKKIEALIALSSCGYSYIDEKDNYPHRKQCEDGIKFVQKLKRWHNWKQQQKEGDK
jgi:hypothetical protein